MRSIRGLHECSNECGNIHIMNVVMLNETMIMLKELRLVIHSFLSTTIDANNIIDPVADIAYVI